MNEGRWPSSRCEIGLLSMQLDDLVRANDGMNGIALAILERLATAVRRSRENRLRARAMLPLRMGLRYR
jgi:hypothetical protein